MAELDLLAISVGNTRTRLGLFLAGKLEESRAVENGEPAGAVAAAMAIAGKLSPGAPVVLGSVNHPEADRLIAGFGPAVREQGHELYRIGRDLVIPIQNALRDDSTVGQDRLLNALGAFSRARQACIVIDAGTAVTVDFVDGEGSFQGGAIAPGLNMMLKALHEHTAALPLLRFEPPASNATETAGGEVPVPWGRDTHEAMRVGVRAAVRGLAHELIDRYAEFYSAYPQVIATGGDARALFENDDLVEHIVPDLVLLGIQAACEMHLGDHDDADADDR